MNRPRRLAIPGITDLPASSRGMKIGLFGGSFNPAHAGHLLVAEQALVRLGLDAVWVLVTPGNPLKDTSELAPLAERVEGARALMTNPQIKVTGFEANKGFTYSYETIRYLTDTLAGRRFVWIMGADNMVGFHQWERWRDIAATIPMAVYVRPGSTRKATGSQAATALRRFRIAEINAKTLARRNAPAWVYLHGLTSPLSSSAIRAGKD